MKQTMKKNQSIQNEKIKTLYSSKKIYNTKYIDNRTMQRLHK